MATTLSEMEIAVTVATNMKFHWWLIIFAVLMMTLAAFTAGAYAGRLAEREDINSTARRPSATCALF